MPFIINIAGHCGSGKTRFIQYMIGQLKNDLNCIIVFSNTANFSEDYTFLEKLKSADRRCFIYNTLDVDEDIKKIMRIQAYNRRRNVKRNVFIIFDDVFSSVKDSKQFKNLATTFRHYNISIAFSAQYISGASSYLREISNYIIVFEQRTINSLKLCFENYFAGEYENFNAFKAAFCKSLKKYHFYFIDRVNNKKFIAVCPPPPKFG